jgi:hypothetical protein
MKIMVLIIKSWKIIRIGALSILHWEQRMNTVTADNENYSKLVIYCRISDRHISFTMVTAAKRWIIVIKNMRMWLVYRDAFRPKLHGFYTINAYWFRQPQSKCMRILYGSPVELSDLHTLNAEVVRITSIPVSGKMQLTVRNNVVYGGNQCRSRSQIRNAAAAVRRVTLVGGNRSFR